MSMLRISDLTADRIDSAWPLINLRDSSISLDDWRRMAAARMARADVGAPRGLKAVECIRGYIYGVFAYAVAVDASHGRVLEIEPLAVAEIAHTESPGQILLQESEQLARELRCNALHVTLTVDGADGSNLMILAPERGYRRDAERLCKSLRPDRTPV